MNEQSSVFLFLRFHLVEPDELFSEFLAVQPPAQIKHQLAQHDRLVHELVGVL